MRLRLTAILCVLATTAFGQQPVPEDPAGASRFSPFSLASQFFENNYFNYYLLANGIFDTYAPVLTNQNQNQVGGSGTSFGYSVGGGLSGLHRFRRGVVSVGYSGNYSHYQAGLFTSGTNQNLNFGYTQRLGRRWNFNYGLGAGILFYNNGFYGTQPNSATYIQANPFTPETRYLSTNIGMNYQFTRRLSAFASGSFYLQRYNGAGAIGATGGGGDIGMSYRLSARTTISGDYARSYTRYQRGAGDANVNSWNFSAFHLFPNHWNVSGFVGITRSNVSGFVLLPANLIVGPQQGVGGYVLGQYNTKANFPAFGGSVSRNLRKSSFSAGAGQTVVSGNGYYLSSKSRFLNGGYSRSFYRSNINAGVNFYRLSSVANTVSSDYSGFSFGIGGSELITSHISVNARYEYLRYGNLAPLNSINDNRITFGFSFSSKSIPFTYY